jgi:hypothetical protein
LKFLAKKIWRLKYDLETRVGNTGHIRRGLWDRVIDVGTSVPVIFSNGSKPRNINVSNYSTR